MTPRILFAFCFFLITALGYSQPYNKRAVKLTEKAEEAAKSRDFEEAKTLLKKAIEADPLYPKAYRRLATIYSVYLQPDSAAYYYNLLTEMIPADQIDERLWDRIAGLNFEVGDYHKAQQAISHVSDPNPLLAQSIAFSVKSVQEARPLEIQELPPAINAYQLQYFPVLTVDERTIIYTKRDANNPSSDEDLVVSVRINDEWIPSQSISREINSPFNEGACTISADGSTLIFTSCEGRSSFGSCDLYVTYGQGNKWTKPENLGSGINSRYWDSQPSLSADGRVLYFASNRPGGVGKRDIWSSQLTETGWSEPVNLGKPINTPFDETTPFIHVNNDLLFFSTQGYPGLGGFDLFFSEKTNGQWSLPTNLGYPINTVNDELSLFINASGTYGYYAIEKTESGVTSTTNIVKFKVPFDSLVKKKASYVTGRVQDGITGKPLGARMRMSNLNDTTDTYWVNSDSISGRYFLVLTEGNEYGVFIRKKDYLFEDLKFEAQSSTALRPDTLDILLHPIEAGASLTLENIYFEFNEHLLNPKSRSELNEIVEYLKLNKSLIFEIQGHTDTVGTESYNLALSEKRARTVYNYLLSKGVDESRMFSQGYGGSQPIADNSTENGRDLNRRITFRVISNK